MAEPEITQDVENEMRRLRYAENVPVVEIARAFNVSRPTVYSHTNPRRKNRSASSCAAARSFEIISLENTDLLWGGGIVPFLDASMYAFVVGRNVRYREGYEEKHGWEIGRVLTTLQTRIVHGQYLLLENVNVSTTSRFLQSPCPYSRLAVQHELTPGSGGILDVVSSLEEANGILLGRAQELAARGFCLYDTLPMRQVVGASAWASQFL